jgi:hypothetical protein
MKLSYQARIAAIARYPNSDLVFRAGQTGHCFELTRHSPDEITLFEEQLGVRLPEEYVQLLLETGSGAGPYCGLFPPGKVLAEIESLKDIVERKGRALPSPSAPFPFQQSDADEIRLRCEIGPSETLGKAVWPTNGCIPICDHGCTFLSALVTAGDQRGKVWSLNNDGAIAEWRPGTRPPGLLPEGSFQSGHFVTCFVPRTLASPPRPPTFIQWYESWLEQMEIDLDDYSVFKLKDPMR